jgi:plastocyanin
VLVSLAALALALAACSNASPSASTAGGASQAGTARCATSTDASSTATIEIVSFAFVVDGGDGEDTTVEAGQTVAFVNKDGSAHTVTEGTSGRAASDACVDEPIGGGQTVDVTFSTIGDYQITCTLHSNMQTVVHVVEPRP